MKVLLVLMGMEIGGAETHVLELAIGLKERGVDVSVASNGGVYTKELEKNGIVHHNVPLASRSPKNMLKSLKLLSRIIKTEKPDVVHGHARIPSFLLGLLCKIHKFRFVTSAHWVFKVTPALKLLSNWGYRTIAVSEDIKSYLTENYGTIPQDISVTINGIPLKKFSIPKDETVFEEFGLDKNKRRIVSISRMDQDRSLMAHKLIEIAPDLIKKEDLEILLVGGGNDYDNIVRKADEMNARLGKKVIFTTGARTDINRFVSVCDFCVAVSRSALEAMCGSIPVIIAGNEGYLGIFGKDSLDNAIKTNFCCRGMEMPTSERLLADLTSLLDMKTQELYSLGEFGKNIVAEFYSVERMVSDNLKMYEDVVRNGNLGKDFVISGYYGHKNSGDDALLYAILQQIRKNVSGARVTVLSASPKETEKLHGVHAVNRFSFFKVRKAIKNSRILISGGGSLIQDVTSTKSLMYYTLLINYAKKLNKKVYIYANGIGPILKKKNEKIAIKALKNADLITLRDENSLKFVKKLNIDNKNVYLTADPVMALSPTVDADTVLKEEGIDGEFVCISIREWTTQKNLSEKIAKCADKLYEKFGLIPVLVPMQTPADERICLDVKKHMKHKEVFKCLTHEHDYNSLMALCKRAKLVVGMRLHMLLYAAAMHTPIVGIIYDPKILGCVSMLGQEENLIYAEDITFDKLYEKCEVLMKNRTDYVSKLEKTSEELKISAEKNGIFAAKLLNGEDL